MCQRGGKYAPVQMVEVHLDLDEMAVGDVGKGGGRGVEGAGEGKDVVDGAVAGADMRSQPGSPTHIQACGQILGRNSRASILRLGYRIAALYLLVASCQERCVQRMRVHP